MVGGVFVNNKIFIQAIGNKLLKQGKCPFEAHCIYGAGNSCSAPNEELQNRLDQIFSDIRSEGGLPVQNTVNPSPWPCDDVMSFVFGPEFD